MKKERPEFEQSIIDLARVTRVTKGGKHLSFRACVVLGDRRGRVGFGLDKGKDVQLAVEKAVNQAKKHMIRVPIVHGTIPHRVEAKFKAGRVLLKPAPQGSGVIAGSAVRTVLELAGIQNISTKTLGKTKNRVVNVKTVFAALEMFKPSSYAKAKAAPVVTPVTDAIVKEPVAPALVTKKVAADVKADETVKAPKKRPASKKAE